MFLESGVSTAVIMFIVGVASLFSYVITVEGVADRISTAVLGVTDNKYLILAAITIILLIVGAFVDAISAFYLFIPILVPILIGVGVDMTTIGVFDRQPRDRPVHAAGRAQPHVGATSEGQARRGRAQDHAVPHLRSSPCCSSPTSRRSRTGARPARGRVVHASLNSVEGETWNRICSRQDGPGHRRRSELGLAIACAGRGEFGIVDLKGAEEAAASLASVPGSVSRSHSTSATAR